MNVARRPVVLLLVAVTLLTLGALALRAQYLRGPDGTLWANCGPYIVELAENLEPEHAYVIDPGFKFPRIGRSNLAVDRRLPEGLIGTAEYVYNRDVNGIYYINANLPAPQTAFTGVDARPRWTANRINNAPGNVITSAIVMKIARSP